MNYWQKRNLNAQNNLANKSIKDTEKQLAKYYKTTLKKTIDDFTATYDKLLATMEDGREPTPADLYKLDKYWQMQSQLQAELQKLGDKELELFTKKFTDTYKGVYESLAIPSEKGFATIDTSLAEQMIQDVWCADNKSWSKRVWENTEKLAETLNEELINCVVQGRKTSELKEKLMERFAVSHSQADALVRTEIAHIQTQSAQKRYKDAGLELVEVWADKDERQCDLCGKLHQKRYKVGDKMPIPAHPNCRCCIIPVIEAPAEATQPARITIEPKKKKSSILPAQTVEEAQTQADKYVKSYKSKYSGNVSYKGLDVEHANSVNRAISQVYEEYDIDVLKNIETMNFREKKWSDAVESGTAGAYQWGDGGNLYINQKLIGTDKQEKAFRKKADDLLSFVIKNADAILNKPDTKEVQRNYITALVNTGRQCVAQSMPNFTEATMIHEMGHALHDKIFYKYQKSLKNPTGLDFSESMQKYGGNISGYAISNSHEYIAESFVAYWYGETDKLDPELIEMFEGAKKK